jgi:hypothetical protein
MTFALAMSSFIALIFATPTPTPTSPPAPTADAHPVEALALLVPELTPVRPPREPLSETSITPRIDRRADVDLKPAACAPAPSCSGPLLGSVGPGH